MDELRGVKLTFYFPSRVLKFHVNSFSLSSTSVRPSFPALTNSLTIAYSCGTLISQVGTTIIAQQVGNIAKFAYVWLTQVTTCYRKPLLQFFLLHHGMRRRVS